MMKLLSKQTYMKFILILLAEALAIVLTELVSKYVVPIKHTSISYIVCGAFLAYVIVFIYDRVAAKRRTRMQRELRSLTDVAMLRYHVRDRDHQQ